MDDLIKMLEQAMDVTLTMWVEGSTARVELSGYQRLMILKALRAASEPVAKPLDASASGAA